MIVRRAAARDIPAILRLDEFGNPDKSPDPPEWFRSFLTTPYFFVAQEDAQVIGFVLAELLRDKTLYLWLLIVHPRHRRQGIGATLYARVEEECRRRRVSYVLLHAPARAVRFWKRAGYAGGLHVVEMNKTL